MNQFRPFLLDIDKDLNFCFVEANAENLGNANFLTRKNLNFNPSSERKFAMSGFKSQFKRQSANYIFHTAFCGSTLLSRLLHSVPEVIALKEPNVLLELSVASTMLAPEELAPYLEKALAELTQPWVEHGHVIIKPTNSCNRIVLDICSQNIDDRFVFMYSTLEEFLVSCLKKMPQAQEQLNFMARHLLPSSELEQACEIPRNVDFSIIEACVLVWYVSLEYFSRAIEILPDNSWMTVPYHDLKREPMATVRRVGNHCRLPEHLLTEDMVCPKMHSDSKSVGNAYDSKKYKLQNAIVNDTYGEAIKQGLVWAENYISKNAHVSKVFR